jgi:hypothetical protein
MQNAKFTWLDEKEDAGQQTDPPFTLLESEMTSPSAGPIGSPRGPRRDGDGCGYAEARCGGVAGPGADRRLRLCEHNNLESMR